MACVDHVEDPMHGSVELVVRLMPPDCSRWTPV